MSRPNQTPTLSTLSGRTSNPIQPLGLLGYEKMEGRKGICHIKAKSMGVPSHILVVEDEPVQRFILQKALSREGNDCRVDTASSAQEALDKAKETHFDLILTDLGMPNMDGVALTEALRAHDAGAAVVWITAHGCDRFQKDAKRLDVYSCLDKPARMEHIRETVRAALDKVIEGRS